MSRWFIAGGAGFLGSHFVERLLSDDGTERVTVYDNLSSGSPWRLAPHRDDARFTLQEGDLHDADRLRTAIAGHDTVVHLASNPDIARALTDPDIDFVQGTALTRAVLEAMRQVGVPEILYASGSGVYGDLGSVEASEDHGPLVPVSTYGASKLAGEALIAAYAAMFDMIGRVFRFGNVIGARQTHGVGYDFVHKLREDPTKLTILGDGAQSKSYIHVTDVLAAVLLAHQRVEQPFAVFNVATGDYATVRDIADITVEALGLDPAAVTYEFTGGRGGWKGDVPIVRLNTDRIQSLGWRCQLRAHAALRRAADELVADATQGPTS